MGSSLQIIANQQTRRVLASLGSPVVEVSVRGKVVEEGGNNVLIIDSVATNRSSTLPIIASAGAKKTLGGLIHHEHPVEVSIKGRVVEQNGSNVLVLDRVASTKNLAITANASTQHMLAELANSGSTSEVSVQAKVINQGGNKVLVLSSDQKASAKKK